MDSKKAKEIKTYWKKTIKHQLRANVEGLKEAYNENVSLDGQGSEEQDFFGRLLMKEQKLSICVMSYLYNEDYDNAAKYVNKYKEFAYEYIEQLENMCNDNCRLGVDMLENVNGVIEEVGMTEREGTFIKFCEDIKIDIQYYETCLEWLSAVICEVKDIRKATKNMRKRKRKNR